MYVFYRAASALCRELIGRKSHRSIPLTLSFSAESTLRTLHLFHSIKVTGRRNACIYNLKYFTEIQTNRMITHTLQPSELKRRGGKGRGGRGGEGRAGNLEANELWPTSQPRYRSSLPSTLSIAFPPTCMCRPMLQILYPSLTCVSFTSAHHSSLISTKFHSSCYELNSLSQNVYFRYHALCSFIVYVLLQRLKTAMFISVPNNLSKMEILYTIILYNWIFKYKYL